MSQIKYYFNGDIMEEFVGSNIKVTYYPKRRINAVIHFDEYNRMHRDDDKPAYLKFNQEGKLIIKIYYISGKCHRDNDKAAYIKYQYVRDKRFVKEKKYYIQGNIMRKGDKPTHLIYHKSSTQVKYDKYKNYSYFNYACFNTNSPMNIIIDNYLIHRPSTFDSNGCRVSKPGLIKYRRDGSVCLEIYYHKGKIHRYPGEGFAKIQYSPQQSLHFVNNKLILDNQDCIKQWVSMFVSNLN